MDMQGSTGTKVHYLKLPANSPWSFLP